MPAAIKSPDGWAVETEAPIAFSRPKSANVFYAKAMIAANPPKPQKTKYHTY
jgi:hypothetical protein